MHGYPPFQGRAELREAIAARYQADHGVALDPDREMAVVPGTKTAIMLAVLACAGAGDAVALPDPGYPDYLSAVALAAARTVALPLEASAGWQPDFGALAGERPALAVLNYPSNPCAVCEQPGTFEAAVAWAHERGAWLLNDLAYGFLAYDGRRARSVLELDGAREVAVELWSPSKIYGMAGWRIGFAVGNAADRRAHPLAARPPRGRRPRRAAVRPDRRAERRPGPRARALRGLPAAPRRADRAPARRRAGGHLLRVVAAARGPYHRALLAEHRVAIAPGEGFGSRGAGYARLSLALDDADLEEGVDRPRPRSRSLVACQDPPRPAARAARRAGIATVDKGARSRGCCRHVPLSGRLPGVSDIETRYYDVASAERHHARPGHPRHHLG